MSYREVLARQFCSKMISTGRDSHVHFPHECVSIDLPVVHWHCAHSKIKVNFGSDRAMISLVRSMIFQTRAEHKMDFSDIFAHFEVQYGQPDFIDHLAQTVIQIERDHEWIN